MRKKIILFISIFLLCGCSLKYEVKITDDLQVEEYIEAVESKNQIDNTISLDDYYKKQLKWYDDFYDHNDESLFERISTNTDYGIKLNKKYSSLEDYANSVYVKDFYKDGLEVIRDNNYITIKNKGFFSGISWFLYELNEEPILSSVVIKMHMPYVVTSSNASVIDEDNTLMWVYNSSSAYKDFKVTFDASRKFVKNNEIVNSNNVLYIIIGVVVLIIAVLGVSLIFKKQKRNNKL